MSYPFCDNYGSSPSALQIFQQQDVSMPFQCQEMNSRVKAGQGFIFQMFSVNFWLAISVYTVICVGVLVLARFYRNQIAFKTRSPKLIVLGVVFFYCDLIGNTIIFSGDFDSSMWKNTCNQSIIVTVVFSFGILMVYILRMYRIYRVFSVYENFLSNQIKCIQD